MKKTLIALAALATTSAFAQSSVTLYGTIDASVQNITRVDGFKNNTAFVDGAVSSSVWGLRGSEDLGGGMKANFQAESDLQSNNGGSNQNGMFRRGMNVSLASASAGEVFLGLKTNPLISAASASVPVGGNTVTTNLASALGYADFYTRNAVTYVSPSLAGLVVTAQHGLSNSTNDSASYGAVNAFSAIYTNGPLKLTVAGQKRGETGAANGTSASNATATNPVGVNKKSSVVGVSYAINNQWTASVNRMTSKAAAVVGGEYQPQKNATLWGLGYKPTPVWTLGLNMIHAEDSNFTNLQARYALSKRTTTYAQLSQARNDANNRVNFLPVASNTSTGAGKNVDGLGGPNGGVAGKNQSAIGVGVIHTF